MLLRIHGQPPLSSSSGGPPVPSNTSAETSTAAREPHRDDATSHRPQDIKGKWVDGRGSQILGKLLQSWRDSGFGTLEEGNIERGERRLWAREQTHVGRVAYF